MKDQPFWFETLIRALNNSPGVRLKGLAGSSWAYAVALLARHAPIAVLPFSVADLERTIRDLEAWLGNGENQGIINKVYPLPPRLDPTLPSPHSDDAGEPIRYSALAKINFLFEQTKSGATTNSPMPVFVIPPATLLQRLPSTIPMSIEIQLGMEIDRDELVGKLLSLGYQPATLVYERGEIRSSGEIVDVYPPTTTNPIRIEFEYEKIARLSFFDPATQRSMGTFEKAVIAPISEVPLDEEHRHKVVDKLSAIKASSENYEIDAIIERFEMGTLSVEDISKYIPWLAEETSSILDKLPPHTILMTTDSCGLYEALDELWQAILNEHWENPHRDFLPSPEEAFWPVEEVKNRINSMSRLELGGPISGETDNWPIISAGAVPTDDLRDEIQKLLREPDSERGILTPLVERINEWRKQKFRIALTCLDGLGAVRLESLLKNYDVDVSVNKSESGLLERAPSPGDACIFIAPLSAGFVMSSANWAVVTEEEIFGSKVYRREPGRRLKEEELESFESGKPVVHVEHGVGIFIALEKLKMGGFEGDYLKIEYLDKTFLYVPVHKLALLKPYRSDSDEPPPLDKIGGSAWSKSVTMARKSVEKVAKELVELYAARKVFPGFAYPKPDITFSEFEASFPYEETPDQARAIEDVIKDMTASHPMDRVICGDVGYGKTEVALRAAFLAAMGGKQVAVLVPTTLLAHQHYRTFFERLKPYPLRVEMLSRFKTRAEQKNIVEALSRGQVDIVIGTHRLLQKDIQFRDLGLVIIDEEHRFGVKHKEKLKQMRRTVDVLSMTATPIPRTLQMSLLGVWDMSIIDTPPPDRTAIRTKVAVFEEEGIRSAIRRELTRGGKVFFVHNRIEGLERIKEFLQRLVPEAKIGVAHGQMEEKKLEKVMLEFINGGINLLLCTAIIESGLDIPKANTIIINQAHTFGLATLYQLRGRVGRSNERGYAYLLVPGKLSVSRQAGERLRALEEFTELGSGYRLARMDLKIRGAGNILGDVQSGHIHRIGYEMYLEMLARAIKEIRGEPVQEEVDPEVVLNISAYLPEYYITDAESRILFYRKLAKASTADELMELKGELLDRFGTLPEPAESLFHVIAIKNILRRWRALSLRREGRAYRLTFADDAPIDSSKVVTLLNKEARKYRMISHNQLLFIPENDSISLLTTELESLLKEITESDILEQLSG